MLVYPTPSVTSFIALLSFVFLVQVRTVKRRRCWRHRCTHPSARCTIACTCRACRSTYTAQFAPASASAGVPVLGCNGLGSNAHTIG